MSSSSSESDSDNPPSRNDPFALTKRLLNQPRINDSLIATKLTQSLIQTTLVHVPIIVSAMLMGRKQSHGGSTVGRRYIRRDRKERHNLILDDYFLGEQSKYTPKHFRRRFRMDVKLFTRILEEIGKYDDYFTHKVDAIGKDGLSPLQKMIAAVRMLAYGCPADSLDEYVQIGESTAIESLKRFCSAIIGLFEERYLKKPNEDDIAKLLKEGKYRGFPGMLGSLDYMHWHWKNCPTA